MFQCLYIWILNFEDLERISKFRVEIVSEMN